MRHFLPLPPRCLLGRMGVPPVPGALVATARFAYRRRPCTLAACWPAVTPSPVARRVEEKHLPALGPAAHHEAQRLHRTPARVGFWRRVPECATRVHRPAPLAYPGAASQKGLPAATGEPFVFLGGRLPTQAVGRPAHNFRPSVQGGPRGQGTPGDRSKNTRFVETINSHPRPAGAQRSPPAPSRRVHPQGGHEFDEGTQAGEVTGRPSVADAPTARHGRNGCSA